MKVEVSNGELLDKLSILYIKRDMGLDVAKEIEALEPDAKSIDEPTVSILFNILMSINTQLWHIEDAKREHERQEDFGEQFVKVARLVYMVNDERAKIKKYIDRMSGSEITEVKSHGSY